MSPCSLVYFICNSLYIIFTHALTQLGSVFVTELFWYLQSVCVRSCLLGLFVYQFSTYVIEINRKNHDTGLYFYFSYKGLIESCRKDASRCWECFSFQFICFVQNQGYIQLRYGSFEALLGCSWIWISQFDLVFVFCLFVQGN